MKRYDPVILIGELLERQGTAVLRAAILGPSAQFVRAVRRCRRCGEHARCRTALDAGALEAYREFCPNAGFVGRAKAAAR